MKQLKDAKEKYLNVYFEIIKMLKKTEGAGKHCWFA